MLIVDVSHSVWNIEVNIFSNNRTNSLAKRHAFAHCCEFPQVWRKCFTKQSRNAKVYGKMFTFIICQSVCENVYIYNFDNDYWYWQMLCQYIDMPIYYG